MKRKLLIMLIVLCVFSVYEPRTRYANLNDPLTTIELDTPVHFLAPDGSSILGPHLEHARSKPPRLVTEIVGRNVRNLNRLT